MNYNLAELDIVEVRKGTGEGRVSQHLWPTSEEQKPASLLLGGGAWGEGGRAEEGCGHQYYLANPLSSALPFRTWLCLARESLEGNENSVTLFPCFLRQITSPFSMSRFFCAENGEDNMGTCPRELL